jgi:hypothetical protein
MSKPSACVSKLKARRGPFDAKSSGLRPANFLLRTFDVSDGEPGRNRTFNQQIKSLLLCQLSYGPT